MTIEKAAYLSIFDSYSTNCGYDLADWFKAREMMRENQQVKELRAELIIGPKDRLAKLRKKYINKV